MPPKQSKAKSVTRSFTRHHQGGNFAPATRTALVRRVHIHKNESGTRKSQQSMKSGDVIVDKQDPSFGLDELFSQFDQSINLHGDDSSDSESEDEIQVDEKTKVQRVSHGFYIIRSYVLC